MYGTRRIATAAFSGVLVAGTVTGLAATARTALADTTVGSCTVPTSGTGYSYACAIANVVINTPQSIELEATSTAPVIQVTLTWTSQCTLNGAKGALQDPQPTSYANLDGSVHEAVTVTPADPDSCTVWAQLNTSQTDPGQSVTLDLLYTPQAPPSPSASSPAPAGPVHQVHGFDGTCMDDKGNSAAKRTKIEIWTCNPADAAQGWTYSGSELKIHNMCVNAKGNGKSGSKIILWVCTGGPNEIWLHKSDGEYVLKANGYKLCLDDPAYSTKNGTQLVVFECHNTPNQHWSLP